MSKKGEVHPLVWMTIAVIAGLVLFMILRSVMCATGSWPFGGC